ncbi:unnamed protein product [Caenorhabditis brenneri]
MGHGKGNAPRHEKSAKSPEMRQLTKNVPTLSEIPGLQPPRQHPPNIPNAAPTSPPNSSRTYPSLEISFRSVPSLAFYDYNIYWVGTLISCFTGFIYATTIFSYTTYSMFNTLVEARNSASSVNFKKQKLALMSLVAQLITSAVGFIPIGFFTLFLIIKFEYAQITTRLFLVVFCIHASVNAVVLVVTTPPFRRYTFFWVTAKRSPVVVSIA